MKPVIMFDPGFDFDLESVILKIKEGHRDNYINYIFSKENLAHNFRKYCSPYGVGAGSIYFYKSIEEFCKYNPTKLYLNKMRTIYAKVDQFKPSVRDRIYFDSFSILAESVTHATIETFDELTTNRNFKLKAIKTFLVTDFEKLTYNQKENFTGYMNKKYPEIKSLLMLI